MASVLLLLPTAPDSPTGNATTARRLAQELGASGHACTLLQCEEHGPSGSNPAAPTGTETAAPTEAAAPSADREALHIAVQAADVVIALNATRSGPPAAALASRYHKALVVLFTGTDLNGKPHGAAIRAAAQAVATVALAPHAQKRALTLYHLDQVELIPQAARPLAEPRGGAPLPTQAPALTAQDFLILHPSGIRSIKNPLFALEALEPVARDLPSVRLWFAGPILEAAYAQRFEKALSQHPWATYLGALDSATLAACMRRANLVLSCSRSEGAAPNALLEAALLQRPIAASDVPAHRYFPGADFLFRDASTLRQRVLQDMDEPEPAALAARRLHEWTRMRFDRVSERVAWDRLVRGVQAGA